MNKKVAFGIKPGAARPDTTQADEWVNRRDAEAMKRLTIDVPASLHEENPTGNPNPPLQPPPGNREPVAYR